MIFISTRSITAMIVCIFEHIQWRWELNDRLALGDCSATKEVECRSLLTVRAARGG
jgi:hypothetical protein